MVFQHFSLQQLIPLIISSIVLINSIFFFHNNKKKIGLWLLFIGSLSLGFFIANLDSFLILWDEQYHALVAKNLINNPLKPTLYSNPLFPYNYANWTENHVWLHKQPLFLWQIALSIKWFGTSALAVRLPSILLHALLPILIYRIGKLVYSEEVGYWGGLFFAVAYFPLELVAGRYSTDHNDIAFLFYVTASIWSWFEYQHTKNKKWLFLIGLFSGSAILVKWLVGLLIYALWFVSIGINDKKKWLYLKSYYPLFISFTITLIVFIPWQIFIHYQYPLEANYERILTTKHFFEAIEEHSGNHWFHLNALKTLYGSGVIIPYVYLLGIIILIKNANSKMYQIVIGLTIVIIYGFYSIAATKMISFCIIASPFVFLGLAALVSEIFIFLDQKISKKLTHFLFRPLLLIVISFFLINLTKIANYHTSWKPNDNFNREEELSQMELISKLTHELGNGSYVIFNADVRLNGHIPIMFYTNYIAYNFIPTQEQLDVIQKKYFKAVIIDNDDLPDYIKSNPKVLKIKWQKANKIKD